MISESLNYHQKVEEYFETLESHMAMNNRSSVETTLARLSPFIYMFTQEQEDFYEAAVSYLENDPFADDDFYEPTEMDEWRDFDPDC